MLKIMKNAPMRALRVGSDTDDENIEIIKMVSNIPKNLPIFLKMDFIAPNPATKSPGIKRRQRFSPMVAAKDTFPDEEVAKDRTWAATKMTAAVALMERVVSRSVR